MPPQSPAIVDLQTWLRSPWGVAIARWETEQFAELVADAFGFHAVQLGLPALLGLAQNRMPSRWVLAGPHEEIAGAVSLASDFTALPFEDASLDLLLLPHTLEWCGEATACLREAERVLRPEGRVMVTGFNPTSALALRQYASRVLQGIQEERPLFLPEEGEFIGPRRLRDWLRLLNFEVEAVRFGIHGLPTAARESDSGAPHLGPLDRLGKRLWPALGAVYLVDAVKRVPGPMLLRAPRRGLVFSSAPVQVASKQRAEPKMSTYRPPLD